jgi:hypothetical protein
MKKIFNKIVYISSNILNKNFKILEQLINHQVIFANFILKNFFINCICKCWSNELNESENEFNNNSTKKIYFY